MEYLIETTDAWDRPRKHYEKCKWDAVQLKYDTQYIFTSHFSYIAGEPYTGNSTKVIIPFLAFDFDDAINPSKVQATAINFVKYLEEIYEVNPDELGIYFSGYKGFHIVLPSALISGSEYIKSTPDIMMKFALDLAGTFVIDTSIYNTRSLLRQPDKVNFHTGYYKTRLEWNELRELGLLEIKAMAKDANPRDIGQEASKSKLLYQKFLSCQDSSAQESAPIIQAKETLDSLFRPAGTGERNRRATALVGLLVKEINTLSLLQQILRLWNLQNKPPLPDKELQSLITNTYRRYHDGRF
jgi:hypothetical protein